MCSVKFRSLLIVFIFILTGSLTLDAQTPAFPTAEGYGKWATGGRGGKVAEVTNLNEDGPGSLKYVVQNSDKNVPLTVVFKVSGTIICKEKYLSLDRSNVTYAGQTAPGDGICFRGAKVKLNGNNIVCRYLRFRVGDELGLSLSALGVENCARVIVDHCSFSWSAEENVTMYDNDYTTMQYCILSEPLGHSVNDKGDRAYGCQWGGEYATYHHNLIAHCRTRAPRFNGSSNNDVHGFVDFRNNVVFNCAGSYGGEVRNGGQSCFTQMVNNYYAIGPSSNFSFCSPSTSGQWYVTGNYMEGNDAANADNWKGLQYDASKYESMYASEPYDKDFDIPTETAHDALQSVIKGAGVIYPVRDSIDIRIMEELEGKRKVTFPGTCGVGIIDTPFDTGGYIEYKTTAAPADNDHDGMADEWETANGLDPTNPEDRNKPTKSGFTCLEVYLNSMAGEQIDLDFTISQKKVHDFVVAKDGSGDFTTINEAIEAAPDNGKRSTIFVKEGIYNEKVFIGDRWVTSNKVISLIGENVDSVIITWEDYLGKQITYPGKGTITADGMTCPTMTVTSPDFYMENITVKNPSTQAQAVALYQSGDGQVLKNCKILGNQDTHRTKKGRRYFYFRCTIEGGVDFIYAGGTCYFYQCDIISNSSGYITAPEDITYLSTLSSGKTIRYGFIFKDCDLLAKSGVSNESVYLGRPWGPECGSLFMNCRLGSHINSKGWEPWNGNESSACFGEYQNMIADGSTLADISKRVSWSLQLNTTDVNSFLLSSKIFSKVSTTKFDPAPVVVASAAPKSLVANNNFLKWSIIDNAFGYVVYANGSAIGFNTINQFEDTLNYATPPVYTVRTVGPYGNLSALNGKSEDYTEEIINEAINTPIDVTGYHEMVNPVRFIPKIENGVIWFDRPTYCRIFSVTGQLIFEEKDISSFNMDKLAKGIHIFLIYDEQRNYSSFKVNK